MDCLFENTQIMRAALNWISYNVGCQDIIDFPFPV